MTDTEKLKRLYILLRWYDSFKKEAVNVPAEHLKLMFELEREMQDLQKKLTAAKRRKKS